MPVPAVLFGPACRERMQRGFETMARVLALTLGPLGGNIINQRMNTTEFELISDGATIARRITELPDRVENVGAMMMRHIVWHMRDQVGDGSATAAVLARCIARDLHRLSIAGVDPIHLRRGVEKGVQTAIDTLDELSRPLTDAEDIAGLATAAMHEPQIGQLLGEMVDVLGPYGSILIQPSFAVGHGYAFREGSRFKGEYVSRSLLSDPARHIAALDDTYVLVADFHFDTSASVAAILELVARADGKNLFIICKNMWEKAIHTLVVNNRRSPVTTYAATIKPVEDLRRDMMMDVALLTGATFVTDVAGMRIQDLTIHDLGYADRIVATQEYITIIGGRGEDRPVQARIQMVRSRLRQATDREQKERLWERIGRLQGGIGELRVGAYTERERTALMEKAAHAVKVVQAGLEGGVVPGGGAAYLAIIPALEAAINGSDGATSQRSGAVADTPFDHPDEAMGARVIARALEEPTRIIAGNAQANVPRVLAACRAEGGGYGYEVGQGKVLDMLEARIVDPTLVVKAALQQAASGAAMLTSAEALVLQRAPPKSFKP